MCSHDGRKDLPCTDSDSDRAKAQASSVSRGHPAKRIPFSRSSSLPHINLKESPKPVEECVPTEIVVVHDLEAPQGAVALAGSFDGGRYVGRRWSGDGDRRPAPSRTDSRRSGMRREGRRSSRRSSMATGPSLDDVFGKLGSSRWGSGSVGNTTVSRKPTVSRRASLTHVRAVEAPKPPKKEPERRLRSMRRNSLTHVPNSETCSYRPFTQPEGNEADARVHRVIIYPTSNKPISSQPQPKLQPDGSENQEKTEVHRIADEKKSQSTEPEETVSSACSDEGSSASTEAFKLFSMEQSSEETSTASSSTHSLVLMNADDDEAEHSLTST